jgi:hypothetical protein
MIDRPVPRSFSSMTTCGRSGRHTGNGAVPDIDTDQREAVSRKDLALD